MPLVSVITPSWNSAAYIEATILSVVNQSYKNVEYIVIDGGSTDGTLDIIKKYENEIAYWVSESDSGMYQAINKGMLRAKGDIVAYLNSDDLYYADTLQQVVDSFLEKPLVDLVYGDLNIIDINGKKIYTQIYPRFNLSRFINSKYAMIGQPAAFWRKRLLKKIGAFDESLKMAADFEFFIRAGISGEILHIPEVLAAFRIHPASLTGSQRRLGDNEVVIIHNKYRVGGGAIYNYAQIKINDAYFKIINWRVIAKKVGRVLGIDWNV
jgi:glycosyltransferase involved in cell wall biosynthesis